MRVAASSWLLAAIPSSAGIVGRYSAMPKTCVDMRTCVRGNSVYTCDLCDVTCSRSDTLRAHLRNQHGVGEKLVCPKCRAPISSKISLDRHIKWCHVTGLN